MREAGFEAIGADPARNYVGVMPWHGSVKEVEQRIADVAAKRQLMQQRLDAELVDDDVAAKQEAADGEFHDTVNAMELVIDSTGTSLCVVKDGEVVPMSELTPAQQRAFERANRAFWPARRESVTV